jgi:hypothetical protein
VCVCVCGPYCVCLGDTAAAWATADPSDVESHGHRSSLSLLGIEEHHGALQASSHGPGFFGSRVDLGGGCQRRLV